MKALPVLYGFHYIRDTMHYISTAITEKKKNTLSLRFKASHEEIPPIIITKMSHPNP